MMKNNELDGIKTKGTPFYLSGDTHNASRNVIGASQTGVRQQSKFGSCATSFKTDINRLIFQCFSVHFKNLPMKIEKENNELNRTYFQL